MSHVGLVTKNHCAGEDQQQFSSQQKVIFKGLINSMKHSNFWEPKNHLAIQAILRTSCSQEPATGHYPQPDQSSPHLPIIFI
jgi:hypothetical protein